MPPTRNYLEPFALWSWYEANSKKFRISFRSTFEEFQENDEIFWNNKFEKHLNESFKTMPTKFWNILILISRNFEENSEAT